MVHQLKKKYTCLFTLPPHLPYPAPLKNGLEGDAYAPGGHIPLTLKTPFPLERGIAEKDQNGNS